MDGQHTKLRYSVAHPIKIQDVAGSSQAMVLVHSGPITILPILSNLVGIMMKSAKSKDQLYRSVRWIILNQIYGIKIVSRWWWTFTTAICSYSSWTEFMSLINSTWKWLMSTKVTFLICKKTSSKNLFAHHIDLLFPIRSVNRIDTYQDMSVQKHLKSFHWGTGKQTIPGYWHTAHWYRLQETPHIHLHLFPIKMW